MKKKEYNYLEDGHDGLIAIVGDYIKDRDGRDTCAVSIRPFNPKMKDFEKYERMNYENIGRRMDNNQSTVYLVTIELYDQKETKTTTE